MQHWDWDEDDEQEKERRLQERRQRVQERISAQKQRGFVAGECASAGAHQSKGKQEVQLSVEAVKQLREQCDAVATAVHDQAEQREEQGREQREQQAAWLKEEIAAEAESCKEHNRAIDLEWEAVHNSTTPQQAHEAMMTVRQHCEQVLQSKDDLIAGITGVLRERDKAYVRLLHSQTEETDTLIPLMAQEYDNFKRGQEQALESVEAAYLQERGEVISAHKAELDALLEKRSALEQSFMDQYLKACEAYESQLETMRVAEAGEHTALKRRLEGEVASLEAHLDGMRSVYMLNADKLQYNVRVLSERERENKEALQQQKRKITRQWEVLSKLKKRFTAMDKRFTEENLKLADEYQRITRAFSQLQTKYRHFKAADLLRFSKIHALKEEELDQLLEQLAEVDAVIKQHVQGLAAEPGSPSPAEACGLAVVGRAITSSAEAPGAGTPACLAKGRDGGEEAEVVVLSSAEAAQRGQLIGAFRPGVACGEGGASTTDEEPAQQGQLGGSTLPPLAWQELRESLEAGVLSLLVGSSGERVDAAKVLRLLQQLPQAAPGRWEAACLARGLGVQHYATTHALEELLGGGQGESLGVQSASAVAAQGEADSVQPKAAGEEAGDGSSASTQQERATTPTVPAALVGAEQVQQGLQRLMGMLQGEASGHSMPRRAPGAASPTSPAVVPDSAAGAQHGVEPTSTAYWSHRVEAVVAQEGFQTWALLEPQLARQFKLLKSRSKAAKEVAVLKLENERLKGRLRERLTSPANAEMQLPTRILLQ